jgi:hypothetical protein
VGTEPDALVAHAAPEVLSVRSPATVRRP